MAVPGSAGHLFAARKRAERFSRGAALKRELGLPSGNT